MKQFNLFKKTLIEFHYSTEELPINLLNPILIKLEFLLDCMNYDENDIIKRVDNLIVSLEKKCNNDSQSTIFFMNSIVLFIDKTFEYYRENIDLVIKASKETLLDIEQKGNEEYWLTSWCPSKVVNEKVYKEGVLLSEKIWIDKTIEVRAALFDRVFNPPFSMVDSWAVLRTV